MRETSGGGTNSMLRGEEAAADIEIRKAYIIHRILSPSGSSKELALHKGIHLNNEDPQEDMTIPFLIQKGMI